MKFEEHVKFHNKVGNYIFLGCLAVGVLIAIASAFIGGT